MHSLVKKLEDENSTFKNNIEIGGTGNCLTYFVVSCRFPNKGIRNIFTKTNRSTLETFLELRHSLIFLLLDRSTVFVFEYIQ